MRKRILCFCLPTVNKFDMFDFLLPSLKNIGELKNYVSFSITFQPPYTKEDINKCLKVFDELKLDYKWEFKEYSFNYGETPLTKIRQDCAMRYPDYNFYALLDDDMSFEEGIDKQYLNLLYTMLLDDNIGVALIGAKLNDYNLRCEAVKYADFENQDFSTGCGIIYRGGKYYNFKGMIPPELIDKIGGKQDISTAVWRVLQGQSVIVYPNGKCGHYENRKLPGYTEYNWNVNSDKRTLLYWLASNDFIRWQNHSGTFYRNFSKEKCEELYKKGCKSSQVYFKPYIKKAIDIDSDFLYKLDSLINKEE